MARLATWGFETQSTSAYVECLTAALSGGSFQGATIVTSGQRSGNAAAQSAADGQTIIVDGLGLNLDRAYFTRAYMTFSTVSPANPVFIMQPWDGTGGFGFGVRLETNGTLTLRDQTNTLVGSASAALSANTFYRIELEHKVKTGGGANSTLGLYLDGTQVARSTTANAGSTGKSEVDMGRVSGTATLTILIDDVAINDDQTGGVQTTLPGDGKVVLLKPTSDSSRTGFTGGGGGTTNLFDAVNNYPPTGVASTGTNASQIGSANSNTTDNYQANMGAYTTALGSGGGGMAAIDTVTLVHALARGSNSTTTARTIGVSGVSNPVITEGTQNLGTTAAGTEPTGWSSRSSPTIAYAPSVTLGTSPVVQVRKATASTNNMMCDLMGLIVEYVAGVAATSVPNSLMMVGSGT